MNTSIRDPSGVMNDIDSTLDEDGELGLQFDPEWNDTGGVGCDDCHSTLYDNLEVWKCNGCGKEYGRL